jgi:hypothetical protein
MLTAWTEEIQPGHLVEGQNGLGKAARRATDELDCHRLFCFAVGLIGFALGRARLSRDVGAIPAPSLAARF